MSGELAIPISDSATTENRLVAIDSGSESSTVVSSASIKNQIRDPSAIRDSERAMVQPPSKSSTIDAWRQDVDSITAPVADPTIFEPDPNKEDQTSNITTSPEIDLNNWRQDFMKKILELIRKPGCPNEDTMLTMIQFLPDERIAKKSLDVDQRRYERRCFAQRESEFDPFPIFGRPEIEQFDRLKYWVHFNLHLMQGHI